MVISDLLSVKVSKTDKKVEVEVGYFVQELSRNRNETITNIPHPDFYLALDELNQYLAKVFHCSEESIESYKATGFTWKSNKEIVITGKVRTDNNKIIGISSQVINIEKDVYEFEDQLITDIESFSEEVLLLLLNKKEAVTQTNIIDEIEKNEAKEEEPSIEEEVEEVADGNPSKIPSNSEFEKEL